RAALLLTQRGQRPAARQLPRPLRRDPPAADVHQRARGARGDPGDRERERGAGVRGRDRARPLCGRAGGGLVTDTIEEPAAAGVVGEAAPCLCQSYLRATEHAALNAARWLGRADQEGAEEAAASGMRISLDRLPIRGRVVLGSPEDESLAPGATLGAGG